MLALTPTSAKTLYIDPDGRSTPLVYMSRPDAIAAIQELQARLLATTAAVATSHRLDGIVLDEDSREVRIDGKGIALPPNPFRVMQILATAQGAVVASERIIAGVWDQGRTDCETNPAVILRVVIGHLRRCIREAGLPIAIISRWGTGYALRRPDAAEAGA